MNTFDPNTVSSVGNPASTIPPFAERPSTIPQEEYIPKSTPYAGGVLTTDVYTSTSIDSNRFPPTEKYPPREERYPTNELFGSGYYPSTHEHLPPARPTQVIGMMSNRPDGNYYTTDRRDPYIPRPRPNHGSLGRPDCTPYCHPYPPHNQHNYQDIYPMYTYPMLYEHNYPMPNDRYPAPYAQHVPTIESYYGRPTSSYVGGTSAMYSSLGTRPTYHANGFSKRDDDYQRPHNGMQVNEGSYDGQHAGNHSTNAVGDAARPTKPQDGGYNSGGTQWEGNNYQATKEPSDDYMNDCQAKRE